MDLKIVSARELALRKSFIKRAVVTETWSDVSPFGDEGLEGCAARGVSADGHRSEGAAMIALPARKNAVTILLVGMRYPGKDCSRVENGTSAVGMSLSSRT